MSGCDCVRCQTEECDASELCSCCLNAEVERLREVLRSTQDLYHEAMEASRRYRGERDIARLDADKANEDWKRVMEATMAAKRGITPAEMEQRLVNAAQSWERDNDERMRLHRGLLIWVPVALAFWALIAVMWMELT